MSEPQKYDWVLVVVAIRRVPKREHIERFVKLRQCSATIAKAYRDMVIKEGFTSGGEKFYPDQLESVLLLDNNTENNNGK